MSFYLHFLTHLIQKIQQVSANGAYDTRACHHVLKNKGITPNISPRSNAGYWKKGHHQHEAVKALRYDKQAKYKQDMGYYKRSLAETVMFRYKQLPALNSLFVITLLKLMKRWQI
ncbi:Mobile element protein [Candidatus Enterovibrio escicola]|uniref:Mobile element protein n=1 Tax=Candidatus Enterovibrio escicola TaxID=1927127 RepID=A0A2A5T4N6_9GAMM|nr:Mobile element protein [Candidatus Enterovibrio escacola]